MKSVAVAIALVIVARAPVAGAQTRPAPVAAQAPPRMVTPVAGHAAVLVTAGVLALGAGTALYLAPAGAPDVNAPHWRGGILFDDAARSALRFNSPHDQAMARTVSDITMASTMLLATADAVAIPLLQGDVDLSWQAGAAYSLALGLSLSLGEVIKRTADRTRPYVADCGANPTLPGCGSADSFGSFYSLHTAVAFTSAGFSCAMHLSRGLYGNQAADGTSCAVSLALATMTGLMRISGDQHYLTDVIAGGVAGFLLGYVIPLLLLPARVAVPSHRADFAASVVPMVAPAPGGGTYGLSVVGQF